MLDSREEIKTGLADAEEIRARADDLPPHLSDEALAQRFTAENRNRMRYVAAWGKWFIWSGQVWRADRTLQGFDEARRICKAVAVGCNLAKGAKAITSAATIAAVERLAKADRAHAGVVEMWDSDPWRLNTPGGIVDLCTGILGPHDPLAYMTRMTAVAPGGGCPLWLSFLDTITAGDAELVSFLQRMAGYCLTGSTREHALFFGHGSGGNGKGVTINTLTGIMADYATVASIETFTASMSDRHPTDLAMLRGARLVTSQETEEGRRWAESRIKALTGGDPITARFMHQDFFTFQPAFKLLIAGNHKPGLRNVDEAIRRRFHLIPFTVKISEAERDLELAEKLRAEWPGILAWAIEGCLEWQRSGLAAPESVKAATAEYLAAEDAFELWRQECCTEDRRAWESSADLFQSWSRWAQQSGEQAGSQKRFGQTLQDRGLIPDRSGKDRTRGFLGLSIKRVDNTDHWANQ